MVGDTYTIKSIGDANWSNAGWVASQVGPNGDKHTSSPQVGDSFVCIHATAGGGGSTSLARAENTCYESSLHIICKSNVRIILLGSSTFYIKM